MIDHNRRTSIILRQIMEECTDGHISIHDFMRMLGDRAFALAILIFSLPNSLPIPGIPGFSTVTGIPIIFIALQLVLGRSVIWMPEKFARKEFSQAMLKKVLKKAIPALVWLEKFLRPRWRWLGHPLGERFLGLLIVALALVLSFPIPGGNFLPGLSISLLALAILERDGVLAAFGTVFAIGSVVVMLEIIKAAIFLVIGWFDALF